MKYILFILIIGCFSACNGGNESEDNSIDSSLLPKYAGIPAPATLPYTIIAQHPHDTSAYTQGLQVYKGKLYEGTEIMKHHHCVFLTGKTGAIEKKHVMGTSKIFGEGISILENKLYQLTWENNIVYVYDVKNIEKHISTFQLAK